MGMLFMYMYIADLSKTNHSSCPAYESGVVFIKGWPIIEQNLLVDQNTFITLMAELLVTPQTKTDD